MTSTVKPSRGPRRAHTPDGSSALAADLASSILNDDEDRHAGSGSRCKEGDDFKPAGSEGNDLAFKEVVAAGGASLLAVLSLLNFFDSFDSTAFAVLGPDIQKTLHLSNTALGTLSGIGSVLLVTVSVPLGYAADRHRRTFLAAAFAAVAAVFTLLTGMVIHLWQMVIVRLMTGAGKSALGPVHSSLLADGYPIRGRARVFAVHNFAPPLAALIAPVIVGAIAVAAGGTAGWRWGFVGPGLGIAVLAAAALALREPPRGGEEQKEILGQTISEEDQLPISFAAGRERLLKIRTLYYLLLGVGVLGFALVGVPQFFLKLLQVHFHYGAFQRGVVGSLVNVGSLTGIVAGGIVGDRIFRRNPILGILLVALDVALFGVVLSGAVYMQSIGLVVIGAALANAVIFTAVVPLNTFIAAVVPPRLRSLGFALVGIYIFLFGGFLGGALIGALSDRYGVRLGLVLVTLPSSLLGAGLVAYGSRFARRDLAVVVEELQEEREEVMRASAALEAPALQLRNIDFSYGPVQVLFGVTFDVAKGEVLALLGTNGAGKSTVLRVISGLGMPDRGVVRLDGRAITYVEAETRVGLGLVQLPGDRAIFPGMTVAENLLAGAHTYIWDSGRVESRIDEVLALFPVLADRLEQKAGTLSGGEQQMLSLAKALLLDPSVLLIDELSLGLAPVMVQELLKILERLRARGLTMVIVEQSINVALAIADRAIFMEKGTVRFSGSAHELLARDDLARAVFFGGEGG